MANPLARPFEEVSDSFRCLHEVREGGELQHFAGCRVADVNVALFIDGETANRLELSIGGCIAALPEAAKAFAGWIVDQDTHAVWIAKVEDITCLVQAQVRSVEGIVIPAAHAEIAQMIATQIKDSDPSVPGVRDKKSAVRMQGQPAGLVQLSGPAAAMADVAQMQGLVFINLINPNTLIASVGNIDPAFVVYCYIARSPESVVRVSRRVKAVFAGLAPLKKRIAIRAKLLDLVIPRVRYQDLAIWHYRNAIGSIEGERAVIAVCPRGHAVASIGKYLIPVLVDNIDQALASGDAQRLDERVLTGIEFN